jgi:hypothetical protein
MVVEKIENDRGKGSDDGKFLEFINSCPDRIYDKLTWNFDAI